MTGKISFGLACLLSVKPLVGLSGAIWFPVSLAGHSAAGLPHALPTAFCGILLALGWWLRRRSGVLFQILSWCSLIGASAFARTPISGAFGVHLPLVEAPLLIGSGLVVLCGLEKSPSRRARYRLVSVFVSGAVLFAIFLPFVNPVVGRWPAFVLGAGFASITVAAAAIIYAYRGTGVPHGQLPRRS